MSIVMSLWKSVVRVAVEAREAEMAVSRDRGVRLEAERTGALLSAVYRATTCSSPFAGWRAIQAYKASLAPLRRRLVLSCESVFP